MKKSTILNSGVIQDSKMLSLRFSPSFLTFAIVIVLSQALYAVDSENCLMCHRFRGLARVDKEGNYRLFYVDETLFNRGPHARVSCKGCHADIEKIPHDNAKPVDCLRSCHIEEPTREIIFTHAKVDETLKESVHALTAEDGTARSYPDDFPKCKDCHDIPLFRPVSMFKTVRAGVSERAVSRCVLCHSDEHFIRYYYSHVTTRMHKARDSREVVAMCSTCHADPAFAKRHNLPDVVSSYLETYHGKAVLFGSSLAPDCLDCHAGKNGVHEMRANTDPNSSVYPGNRASTCRTQDCHSTAAPDLASFDVHATHNPRTHPLEFSVALFFVFLTLGVLLPILTLNVLSLIRELFPSKQAKREIEHLIKLAEKKAAEEGGIRRFTLGQRLQHVFLVVVFVVLCLTGFPMKFPDAPWAPPLYELFGGIHVAPIIHRIAGVALIVGFIFHCVMILVNVGLSLKRKGQHGLKAWIREILALPMIPKWRDFKDLYVCAKYSLFLSPHRPTYAWFCWKEKLEYFGVFWGTSLVGVAGVLMWGENWSSHVFPGWALNVAYLVHTDEVVLAVTYIGLIHIQRVLGRPGLSVLSAMILNGKISPRVLAEDHGEELIRYSEQEHGRKLTSMVRVKEASL